MELGSSDFSGFFRAIHGHRPFPWQQDLVETLARNDEWPDVLDLPTGTGKTAALDVAVFHLALRSNAPGRAALRIALVVDRRLVVDDTFERAKKIADALNRDTKGCEIVEEVARRLKKLAGEGKNRPLVAKRLRGGAPLEHDWARTPTQPTILCSTVDQVGSRLLFRGYGVSDRMKPIHAGLLGVDSLILLDEAHLSEPFRQTLDAVRKVGNAKINVAILSATPGAKAVRPFTLSARDRADPDLKKRLEAKKPVAIRLPGREQNGIIPNPKTFANEARAIMERLREQRDSSFAVGVIVNRVALARAIYEDLAERLAEKKTPNASDIDVILLIGRSRSVDRDAIGDKLVPFQTGSERRAEAKSLFVVATQCLEVGVDLDLDGLVTQAASLDALRQRFGRLNRAGRSVSTEGAIIVHAKDIAKKAVDPVYGDRIRTTWETLERIADGDIVDFGVEALPARLKKMGVDPNDLAAERLDAPVVMPAYLDLWSQTSPRPAATPEVSLFLHGAERMSAGVSIVWRGDISESDLTDSSNGSDRLKELIRFVPPRASEAIEIPLWTAIAWLNGAADVPADISDAPEREGKAQVGTRIRKSRRRTFRWAGPDDPRTGIVEPDGLKAGDLLVVPSDYGGCDRFGWKPDSDSRVVDVGDEAAEPYQGRRFAVRIARDIVHKDEDAQWKRVRDVFASDDVNDGDLVDSLIKILSPVGTKMEDGESDKDPKPRDVRKQLEALRHARGRFGVHFPYAGDRAGGAILFAERGIKNKATSDISAAKPVYLDDHGCRVAGLAQRFAQTLGFEDTVADDLGLAAFLHDAGKADRRFQIMLLGGGPWNRPDGPPLAKSGRSWVPDARARAGLPVGWRHEALSVRMAREHPRFSGAHDPALVLWLIGSHHGQGRPLFDFRGSQPEQPLPCLDVADWQLPEGQWGPQSLAFDLDGADWPSLFENLKHRHGIWGLAHLEAILRLADHRASEEERES